MSTDGSVTAELDPRFSTEGATATQWEDGLRQLTDAQIYWVCTMRADVHPHVTPLMAVWRRDALYFCTGPTEQKAKNLGRNAHCTLITGCNTMAEGLDVVVDGDALGSPTSPSCATSQRSGNPSTAATGTTKSAMAPSITPLAKHGSTKSDQPPYSASPKARIPARPAGASVRFQADYQSTSDSG
jgi:hypothetical protein